MLLVPLVYKMLHGDKQCKQQRLYWWSKKLHRLRLWRSVLYRLLSGFKTGGDFHDTLHKILAEHDMQDKVLPNHIHDCHRTITLITEDIKQLDKKSAAQRSEEQVARAAIYDTIGRKEDATLVREIRHSEQMTETYRLFKNIRSDKDTSGLTKIEVPHDWPDPHTPYKDVGKLTDPKQYSLQDNPQWRLITQSYQINYYLLLRNRLHHFGQAQGTPFTEEPFAPNIDWAASTPTAESILDGTHEHADLDKLLRAVLEECTYKTAPDTVTGFVAVHEFLGKFKSWNEKTSISPSGRHLGLYKALVARIHSKDPNKAAELEATLKSLTQVHVNLINYCLKFRYSLTRWQQIINAMILMSAGDYRIHHLRIIHLYEADLNFILGLKWRQLLHHADQLKLIADPWRTIWRTPRPRSEHLDLPRRTQVRHLLFLSSSDDQLRQ
jgi:hypothetical protein